MASSRLSATKIGVGALIALTLATAVATVVSLQGDRADSVPTAIASSPAGSEPGSSAASQYAVDLLSQRGFGTDSAYRESTLSDLLPNHLFAVGSSDPQPLASGIVIGTVASVEPGLAYTESTGGESTEVDFHDPDAIWRDIVVSVTVDSALGEVSGDSTVRLGLAVDGTADIDRLIESFASLGRVIAVVETTGKFSFEPDLYSIRQGGGLFGLVAEDGTFTFPYLGSNNAAFLDGMDTVTDVLTEGTGPDVISKVERAGSTPSTD